MVVVLDGCSSCGEAAQVVAGNDDGAQTAPCRFGSLARNLSGLKESTKQQPSALFHLGRNNMEGS